MLFERLENRELLSSVTALSLIDASNGQTILRLSPDSTINLSTLPTRSLNVRADATADAQSVKFGYDANGKYSVDNTAPYLMGAFTPTVGKHSLSATAYTRDRAKGTASTAMKVNLMVIDQSPTPTPTPTPIPTYSVSRLVLVNADTGQDIGVLSNGEAVDLGSTPAADVSVRADVSGSPQSVRFGLDANTNYHVENASPYALAGDVNGTLAPAGLSAGAHAVTATAYALDGAGGTASTPLSLVFTLVQSDPAPTPNTAPANPSLPGTWNAIFVDDFNALPDTKTWTSSLWGMTSWGTSELQVYDRSALSTANGVLNMTATAQPLQGKPYTSALISTGGTGVAPTFAYKYGYAEARIKLPAGQGMFPAFWMLPATYNYQYDDDRGEIDVMEMIGKAPTRAEGHVHRYGQVWGGVFDNGTDLTKDFHTYGVDWEPDHLTWYVDGKAYYTVSDPAAIPTVAEYLIMNLAIGGSWSGPPDATTVFPATMQVDYVKVWQKAP